ncbi:hypothetical protein TWF730_006056 [Orbilia blumenaviensis]|uniref:Uncharacterized protein n=1 Tax=Orbilia blumenaviensis TaxID=1796055 RepID=A0AAV9VMH5_9PEZI
MALPRRLKGCTHLFSFLSVLASSRNSIHHVLRSSPHPPRRNVSSTRSIRPGSYATAKPYKRLQLQPEDRDYINKRFDQSKPTRLRTQDDYLNALRAHGYVPAVDRVDEMLDMNRSPYQSKDEFDKLTLALLLRSAKSANGEIRNPYKIPTLSAGQNPVRTRTGDFPKYRPVNNFFLFPDDMNWGAISQTFPLQEPPRPWHPVTMIGLKQDYTREEVARRLEWSQVQNAKKLRNGYAWPAPDPATYKYMERLPQPPPPVIRECNTCKKPRYLLRFWNFYTQQWQHVSSPHRPVDCNGHQKGGGGRLMFAPKGTKIGGLAPSKVENKEWIEEETAVKLLFRSGFIALPSVNPVIGEYLAYAAINKGDRLRATSIEDATRWALRGGRKNGLVDLSKVSRMDQVEKARKEQQKQFLEEHKEFLVELRDILKEHPITPESAALIPPGQFYPSGHPAVIAWRDYEFGKVKTYREELDVVDKQKAALKRQLKKKLQEVDVLLEQMKVTKAEILLLERGQGETWANPGFASLRTRERANMIQARGESDRVIIERSRWERERPDISSHEHPFEREYPYSRWDQVDGLKDASHLTSLDTHIPAPTKWLEKAASPEHLTIIDEHNPVGKGLGTDNSTNESLNDQPNRFSTYPDLDLLTQKSRGWNKADPGLKTKSPPFRKTPKEVEYMYKERFRETLTARVFPSGSGVGNEKPGVGRILGKLEGSEEVAIRREEDAFALREAFLWSNTRGPVPAPSSNSDPNHEVLENTSSNLREEPTGLALDSDGSLRS